MPEFPCVTADQMKEADRACFDEYGITAQQLMENAGRSVADACRLLLKRLRGANVLVLTGKGNNGGDSLVAARFLRNWGANIMIVLPEEVSDKAVYAQLDTARRMGIDVIAFSVDNLDLIRENIRVSNLIVDGLLGYGLKGKPRPPVSTLINFANESGARILAVDVPSGLDATTGEARGSCIKASATVTFGVPKAGLLRKEAMPFVGELYLADIGIPPKVYERFGIEDSPVFSEAGLLKIY
jgi:hydroxyethylthiazole kinase-like uncharacterized protein yjeF